MVSVIDTDSKGKNMKAKRKVVIKSTITSYAVPMSVLLSFPEFMNERPGMPACYGVAVDSKAYFALIVKHFSCYFRNLIRYPYYSVADKVRSFFGLQSTTLRLICIIFIPDCVYILFVGIIGNFF